jgi:hypothetical protein
MVGFERLAPHESRLEISLLHKVGYVPIAVRSAKDPFNKEPDHESGSSRETHLPRHCF